tara:strand:+ start:54 stop:980 length:927 start_codon:yes stop_codon:yes gene_type:complete
MVDIKALATKIRSGQYPKVPVDVDDFFDENGYPLRDKRIQVRNQDRDIDRITRAVDKMESSGDTSKLEDLTLIKFPGDSAIMEVIEDNLKILNGSHTVEMEYLLKQKGFNIKPMGNIVDFVKDLGGKWSNAYALGNILNEIEVEKVDIQDNDIKKHLYQLIDETNNKKLSDSEIEEFMSLYPRVSRATIGQWISYHDDVGTRKSPHISYSRGELEQHQIILSNLRKYRDYVVLEPRNLKGALETGVAQAFRQMQKQDRKKCLIILYCESIAQANQWRDTDIEDKIKTTYSNLSSYFNITIEYEMLSYD